MVPFGNSRRPVRRLFEAFQGRAGTAIHPFVFLCITMQSFRQYSFHTAAATSVDQLLCSISYVAMEMSHAAASKVCLFKVFVFLM